MIPYKPKDISMQRRTAIAILSAALFCSFFFPIFNWHHYEMSGLNYILSDHISGYKYFLLLIPFSSLFVFWSAVNTEAHFFNRKKLSYMPFLSLLFISIRQYSSWNSGNNFFENERALSSINFGFWMILLFSGILIVASRKNFKYGLQTEE
jgi:hypothetical protein